MFIDNMQKWCMHSDVDCICNGNRCPMYDTVLECCELKKCPQQWDVSRLIHAYTEILEIMHDVKTEKNRR